MLKPGLGRLSFAAMTVGAMIPDIEPLVAWIFGWSVFCGWDFPCSPAPDRLVLHSIVGALTVDVALTILFVKILGRLLKVGRLGIRGFDRVKIMDVSLYVSAAIGALSHVLVDWLHHPANPIFWPFLVNGSYYVGGLLLQFMGVLPASALVAAVSSAIMVATVNRALNKSGHNFWLVLSNPPKALMLITENLSKS
ncbi:hypothetical protein Ngar_c32450 [Candidatus Nitrososphaera gargensis Ga9.2]|uniref:DUF4184 family protein n=2 Tax=Candidatus Nitrososphaera gargensis TaxID=497727 RepID=K0IFM1_NITGG|nr:hypothetical protein Ngar_c32450 [Candidatus Nitrososphaera gargensis Ga9.2]